MMYSVAISPEQVTKQKCPEFKFSRLTKLNLFIVCINSSYTSDSGKKEINGILYPTSLMSTISGSETMNSEKALPILLLIALIPS